MSSALLVVSMLINVVCMAIDLVMYNVSTDLLFLALASVSAGMILYCGYTLEVQQEKGVKDELNF